MVIFKALKHTEIITDVINHRFEAPSDKFVFYLNEVQLARQYSRYHFERRNNKRW